jgi:outer membrane protein assembly factor BamD
MVRFCIRYAAAPLALAVLLSGCGLRRHKYVNPINKDTQQPDKVLFDTAIDDLEHSRFERARLTLQTLMNTYDTSEYLAKAKLAVADSWYQEGGAHGLAQAEAEYKDFILFYPQMEEAAEAQEKVCDIHYKQMEKSDRDPLHALRAEDECRQLLVQFPNSKFAPKAQQMLRDIQEVLADSEYKVGVFYAHKGSFPAAANRLNGLTNQFPLYSKADDALWDEADAYKHMGDRFENQQAAAYTKIVKDYPLSAHVDEAKQRLTDMKRPVPEADPVAYARMKYELENQSKPGVMSHALGIFRQHPDTRLAAKSGEPQMTGLRPTVPATVPQTGTPGATGTTDVSASVSANAAQLDQNPNQLPGTAPAAGEPGAAPAAPASGQLLIAGIDVNSASQQQLERLKLSKSQTKKIIAARPFASVDDLKRAGVPQKTIDLFKRLVDASGNPGTSK